MIFFSIPFAMDSVRFPEQRNMFHFFDTSRTTFTWESFFIREGISFKAQIQYITTKRYMESKEGRKEIRGKKEERKERGGREKKHYFSVLKESLCVQNTLVGVPWWHSQLNL